MAMRPPGERSGPGEASGRSGCRLDGGPWRLRYSPRATSTQMTSWSNPPLTESGPFVRLPPIAYHGGEAVWKACHSPPGPGVGRAPRCASTGRALGSARSRKDLRCRADRERSTPQTDAAAGPGGTAEPADSTDHAGRGGCTRMQATPDRRRVARLLIPRSLGSVELARRRVYLLDLSPGGVRIEHRGHLHEGLVCFVDLPRAFGRLRLTGRVVWTKLQKATRMLDGDQRPSYHSGLAFIGLTSSQQSALVTALEVFRATTNAPVHGPTG